MPTRMRGLLWLGVIAPIVRHIVIYSLGAVTTNYSARTNFISELGALGAPHGLLMNVGTGLIGLMMIVASVALFKCLSPLSGGPASAILIGISGVAFVGVALFPCNPGCDVVNLGPRMVIHLIAGSIATGAEVIAPFTVGLFQILRKQNRGLGWVAFSLGIIGLVAYVVLFVRMEERAVAGLVQRIVQGSGDAWLFIASIYCLGRR